MVYFVDVHYDIEVVFEGFHDMRNLTEELLIDEEEPKAGGRNYSGHQLETEAAELVDNQPRDYFRYKGLL